MADSFKNSASQALIVESMLGFNSYATGMPIQDAQDDFQRARRAQVAARLVRFLGLRRRRPTAPRTLSDATALAAGVASLEVVPLACIVGTLETSTSFDARFRPAANTVRRRWERIALAHRTGVALPPIAVVQRDDGYYVVDGCHRVSVARALGHRDIDAWVRRATRIDRQTQTRSVAA